MGRNVETDEDLLYRVRAGERAAFAAIVDRYQRLVCGVCFSATRDWALSEDLAQDTFVAAWRRVETLREPQQLSAWLCGIARNLSHKARRREKPTVNLDEVAEPPSPGDSPLDAVLENEMHTVVARALAGLPENYREPLVLYYQHGRSASEVGAALGLSASTVHQRISRGRRLLEDEVRVLVETSLSQNRPQKGFTAAVLVALDAPSRASAAAAAVATKGAFMSTSTWFGAGAGSFGVLLLLAWLWEPAPRASEPSSPMSPPVDGAARLSPPPAARPPLKPPVVAPPPQEKKRPEPRIKGESIYALEGIRENWAEGALGDLLGPCFGPPKAAVHHRFALTKASEGWSVDQVEGPVVAREVQRCIARQLTAFGVDPEDGTTAVLDRRFEARDVPSFDPDGLDMDALRSGPFLGAPDAPVTMFVFVAFKCLYCGRMLGTVDQLLEDYGDKLKVVLRPYALRDTDIPITEAAYAAEAQGRFFALHDAMLADQASLQPETLEAFAKRAELDLERFARDLRDETYRPRVLHERDEARQAGVRGVPATILDGEYIVGAQPIDVFREKIDAVLAKL
ncbi:MAG: sigma-70 family RNA polymerase sigma factor [Myxococcota bacterium]